MANKRDVELNLEGNDHTGRATRSAATNLDRLRQKVTRFNTDTKKSMMKSGTDSATAFFQSFLRGLTFGKLGATVDSHMGPQFARMGIRMGGVFAAGLAGAVLVQSGNLIMAGLPLILGAGLLAIPLIRLVKTNGKAVDRVKRKWTEFTDFISAPLKNSFLESLGEVKGTLDRLKKPVRDIMEKLEPALKPFTKGVLTGLENFVLALSPAMPGITAGIKEWGKQAPGIGKGVGDAIAALLKDPEAVKDAVKTIAGGMTEAATAAGMLAGYLIKISGWYDRLKGKVDKFEESTGSKNGGPLGGMWNAVKRNAHKITGAIRSLGNGIQRQWNKIYGRASDFASRTVHRVVAWFKRLPGMAGRAISRLWASLKSHFDKAVHGGGGRARAVVSTAVRFLKRLPGAAGRAVAGLWGHMKGAFQTVLDGVSGFASKIAAKVRTILGLKAKASGNPGGGGGGSTSWASGPAWAASPMAGMRTGGPTQVNVAVAAPTVNVSIDGRALDARIRIVVREENRRDTFRARVGRR